MTAVSIAMCRCGHGERLHERDDVGDDARGVCFKNGCGCAEYQPRTVDVDLPDEPPPAPAATAPLATTPPVADSTPVEPPRSYKCAHCGQEFTSKQGLGGHAAAHNKARTAAGPPPAAAPQPAAPAASTPVQAAKPRHYLHARISFGAAGTVDLEAEDLTTSNAYAIADIITAVLRDLHTHGQTATTATTGATTP